MLRPFLLSTAAAMLTVSPAAADQTVKRIPVEFHGAWDEPEGGCKYNFRYLKVEAEGLYFEEADGNVTSVIIHNNRTVSVVAKFNGEWTPGGGKPIRLTLSADGKRMTANVSGPVKLVRCS